MVADDDPNIRELIHVLLKNEGFDILEAVDGGCLQNGASSQ